MAVLRPASCPPGANAAERVVYAAVEAFLDDGWTAWFQARLPGRAANPHRAPTPQRADCVLLAATGLTIIEVKGWRASSIVAVETTTIGFRNGVRVPHPLVQAYRYTAALTAWLREQPGVLRGAAVPVRYAVVLPYLCDADLVAASWGPLLRDTRLLLAGDLGPTLPARLAELPPPGGALSLAQQAAVARLLIAAREPGPPTRALPLFEDG